MPNPLEDWAGTKARGLCPLTLPRSIFAKMKGEKAKMKG